MKQGGDREFSWLQQAYVEQVRPGVLGNRDASDYSPQVAPTAIIVTGVEGANLSAAASRAAATVDQAGGRAVVIDAVALRGMHDRLNPGLQSDVAADVNVWASQLAKDATRRRLDPVVSMTAASPRDVQAMVDALHDTGTKVIGMVVRSDPGQAARAAYVSSLSGDAGDQVAARLQAKSQAALAQVVDRLDRDRRIGHIRIVDEAHRTVFRADASRHARGDYEAASRLEPSAQAGQARANPFRARPGHSVGPER